MSRVGVLFHIQKCKISSKNPNWYEMICMVIMRHKVKQWRNVTIWCPPADFFAAPTNFLLSPLFSGFSYRLLAPLELFVPPNIFFASTER